MWSIHIGPSIVHKRSIGEQVEKTDLSACLDLEWLWNADTVTRVAAISEFILEALQDILADR